MTRLAGELRAGRVYRREDLLPFSPSAYNPAGLGATQLYNRTLVYNHKRHGVFKLGYRQFDFRMKSRFPKRLSPEFLFVDALNNLADLAEDPAALLERAQGRAAFLDRQRLLRAVESHGSMATRKRLAAWLHA